MNQNGGYCCKYEDNDFECASTPDKQEHRKDEIFYVSNIQFDGKNVEVFAKVHSIKHMEDIKYINNEHLKCYDFENFENSLITNLPYMRIIDKSKNYPKYDSKDGF